MVKEATKKCSHCGQNGHNTRTCNGGKVSFKLFGVRIEKDKEDSSCIIRKNKSTGDLLSYHQSLVDNDDGYLSDGPIHSQKSKPAHDRKKGVQWNEEEHQAFLLGLEKLGKGDWKGISKEFVPTRTPTQVASHAQKYFVRLGPTDKKRRSSLFDMPLKESGQPSPLSLVAPSKTRAETSQQASTSDASPWKKTMETQAQASTSSAQVAKPQDVPPVLPTAATYGVPNFHCVPYMVGVPNTWQSYAPANVMPTLPFVAMMNYHPNQSSIVTCAPFMPHMLPQLFPHGSSQAGS